jgi:signal transduction histidine kinase
VFRLRDWRVRTKLGVVLAIPVIGFLFVIVSQVSSSVNQADELDQFARRIAVGRQVVSLIGELQLERDRTAGALAVFADVKHRTAPTRDPAIVAPNRSDVDKAVVALRAAVQPLLNTDPVLRQAYETADTSLRDVAPLREGADQGWLRVQGAIDGYTQIISDLLAMLPLPSSVGGDEDLGRQVRIMSNLARVEEYFAQIRARLYAVTSANYFGADDFQAVADARAGRDATIERLRLDEVSTDSAIDDTLDGRAVRTAQSLELVIIDAPGAMTVDTGPTDWWRASTAAVDELRTTEGVQLEAAITQANESSSQRWRSTMVASGTSVALLLAAVLLSMIISRSMANTLRTLRDHALDVANVRLPRVIHALRTAGRVPADVEGPPVRAADEIGDVGEAFAAVHRSAVRLAGEQAQMRRNVNEIVVNLARRSQSLVERQLQLLDAIETAETDPEQLANLFRLDHLATRMRRNDENLLVLAGGEATRRWTEPVPLTAVVLAAAAEIENYSRIRHDISDNVFIAGHVVADLVHLVAELLENAATFSPPKTWVTVLGWSTQDGSAVLMITDQGIGMSPDVLVHANQQLKAPISIDVAAAERMGLVVVGHLAERYGIHVELRPAEPGIHALVALPPRLLSSPPAQPVPVNGSPARWLVAGADGAVVEGAPGQFAQRAVPTRAEDILGRRGGTQWWTRGAGVPAPRSPAEARAAAEAHAAASAQAQAQVRAAAEAEAHRRALEAGTSNSGLPYRVPMAQLPPGQAEVPAPVEPAESLDPDRIGAVLSGFYGGVQRANAEDSVRFDGQVGT